MCGNANETTEHLLFHCPCATEVWNLALNPISLNIDTSSTFLYLYQNWIRKPRSEISLELMLTKMWFIWKERCNRAFENKSTSARSLSQAIQGHISFWSKKGSPQSTKINHCKNNSVKTWQAPLGNKIKINFDAARISNNLPSSYVIILRDNAGDTGGGKAGQSTSQDPQEAEAIGVYRAENWAQETGLENFSIEGDCESLFNYMKGKNSDISWH
ncbi:uncharacterized protein LOC113305791 [Papaver somniferum]|uniref:uncharacterized protein LOC113305791 n=1 Tax=Papaver somniferum TaxID=3469 RepID=UPI000E704687|nr:uncharacterized protein LOC113305791 [Papaver somniferum]